MSVLAWYSQSKELSGNASSARLCKTALVFILGIVFVPGLTCTDADDGYANSITAAVQADRDDGSVVVVSLANVGLPADNHTETMQDDVGAEFGPFETSSIMDSAASLPTRDLSAIGGTAEPVTVAPGPQRDVTQAIEQETEIGRDDESRPGHDPAPNGCGTIVPGLVGAFRSILMQVATLELERIRHYAALAQTTVIGTASTYNPYVEGIDVKGIDTGDTQTSSGEFYDPEAWTAAIQIDLRDYFGGVRYGRNYQPAYALVDNGERQIIVKINDVGPLKPGRVIDLNERSMRYFDPTLQLGLVRDMRITLLSGDDWKPGPVASEPLISVASAQ